MLFGTGHSPILYLSVNRPRTDSGQQHCSFLEALRHADPTPEGVVQCTKQSGDQWTSESVKLKHKDAIFSKFCRFFAISFLSIIP